MDPVTVAPERPALEQMVDLQRAEVARMLDGLDEDQARRRLVPSLTTALGLVKHLTFVERVWFAMRLSGRTRAELGLPEEVDESFVLHEEDTIASVLADGDPRPALDPPAPGQGDRPAPGAGRHPAGAAARRLVRVLTAPAPAAP